jgi:TRAP-type C4-dicarboxylate transport system permease small subunit
MEKSILAPYKVFMHLLVDWGIRTLTKVVGIAMVMCILLQILTRLFLRVPFTWTDELARGTFVWYCFLGSVLATRQYAHLGIDYFRSKLSERGQWISDLVVALAIIVFGAFVAILGWQLLGIVGRQRTPIMRIYMQWFYLVVPLSGALIGLQGLEFLLEYLATGKPRPPAELEAPPPGAEAFLESAHR